MVHYPRQRKSPGGASDTPGPGPQEVTLMAKHRILENALTDEAKRAVLHEAETRYRNELMSMDEREVLWNRILRLRRSLNLTNV